MNILEINKLNKFYDAETHALKDIDLNIKQGEFLILLGLSGSGKSTLLRCLNRLIEPTNGQILFEGKHVESASKGEMQEIRSDIAMIFQQFNLVKNLSVLTNVLTGNLSKHKVLSVWSKEEKDFAMHNLKRVGLEDFAHRKVRNLSGGQQQRVAIARALMQRPKLILADEPVASLDPATADSVMNYLGTLNKEDGITVICSLHFLSLARKYGSRVVALKDGNIKFSGSPHDIDEKRFKDIYGQQAEEVEIR
jgi:phosphonate transport system ATP-binding protein